MQKIYNNMPDLSKNNLSYFVSVHLNGVILYFNLHVQYIQSVKHALICYELHFGLLQRKNIILLSE